MKIFLRKALLFGFILLLYFLPTLIFKTDPEYYNSLKGFKLPAPVFGIVWSFIFITMSLYITFLVCYVNNNKEIINKGDLRKIAIFLVLNYLLIGAFQYTFFTLHNLFLAYIITLSCFFTIAIVALETLLVNKKLTFFTLPYVIWSIVASVLSILTYLQN